MRIVFVGLLFVAINASAGETEAARAQRELAEDITAVARVAECAQLGSCSSGQTQESADPTSIDRLAQLCRRFKERYHGVPGGGHCGITPEMMCDGLYDWGAHWESAHGACGNYPTAPCCKDEAAFDAWRKTWEQRQHAKAPHVYTDTDPRIEHINATWCDPMYEKGLTWDQLRARGGCSIQSGADAPCCASEKAYEAYRHIWSTRNEEREREGCLESYRQSGVWRSACSDAGLTPDGMLAALRPKDRAQPCRDIYAVTGRWHHACSDAGLSPPKH